MEKVLIVYWSGTGNTETMAHCIAQGIEDAGAEADIFEVSGADTSLVESYEKIAFGCPSMGVETLEEDEFEPFFESVEDSLSGKKVGLFGSYDWGDGEWMRDWEARVEVSGAKLMGDGLISQLDPDQHDCTAYGKQFAEF